MLTFARELITRASIVICTHNPNRRIFAPCLEAVARLRLPEKRHVECVIVDNGSRDPVAEIPFVREFLAGFPGAKVIQEPQLGLSRARIAGLEASRGEILVWFDDDNLPADDYLEHAVSLIERYPWVGAWGPGTVDVRFDGAVPAWIAAKHRNIFQERQLRHVQYGCVVGWTDYYPSGTGLIVRRSIMEAYAGAFGQGLLKAVDRRGESFSSCGDAQIVWTAVKDGFAAGVAPQLKLEHRIAAERARAGPIAQMLFGVYASSAPALVGVFPEEQAAIREQIRRPLGYLVELSSMIVRRSAGLLRRRSAPIRFALAVRLGEICGRHEAVGLEVPGFVTWLVRLLRLKK